MISLRRTVVAVLLVAAFLGPAFALLESAPNAAAYSGIDVTLQRPAFAGIGQKVECVMTITGGPAEAGGNYSYSASVVGTNTTGAGVFPSTGSPQRSGTFVFNVTMPTVGDQTIKIRVNVTSTSSSGGKSDTLERDFEMKVVVPITIYAAVVNTGSISVSNVTASFFADGVLLSTRVFNISANGTQKLIYNWTFLTVTTGKHVIMVTINDPYKVVEFSTGGNVMTRDIWVGSHGNPLGALLSGVVVVLAFLVFLVWIQKPMRRPKARK